MRGIAVMEIIINYYNDNNNNYDIDSSVIYMKITILFVSLFNYHFNDHDS